VVVVMTMRKSKHTLSKKDDGMPVREDELVNLRLDVDLLNTREVLECLDLNLIIKVTDIADYGVVAHFFHVLDANDITVSGCGDEDFGPVKHILQPDHLIAGHTSLEGTDWVDLGHNNASTLALERLRRALANITITADTCNLQGRGQVVRIK